MPFQSGVFKRIYNWTQDAANKVPITPSEFDNDGADVALALSNCILRDGTGVPVVDLPMAGHGLTGIRAAVAAGEAMEYAQTQAAIAAAAGGNVANRVHNPSFLVNQRAVAGTVTLQPNTYGHDRWKSGSVVANYSFAPSGADTLVTIIGGSLIQVILGADIDFATMAVSQGGTAQGRLYPVGATTIPAFQNVPFVVTGLTPGAPAILEWGPGTLLCPQVQPGIAATPFVRRPVGIDKQLCQQVFERYNFHVTFVNNYPLIAIPSQFKVSKYSLPTITLSNVVAVGNYTQTSTPINPPLAIDVTTEGFTFRGADQQAGNDNVQNTIGSTGTVSASCEP